MKIPRTFESLLHLSHPASNFKSIQILFFGSLRRVQEGPGPVKFKLKNGEGSALDSSDAETSDGEDAEQTNGPKKVP